MIANRFLLLALTLGACAAFAYAVGRHTRQIEKKQFKEDLRTWEGEGGTPAVSSARPATSD
jgi:hypothetical protein